ncbi:FadR/GntR family transcriptional regulator [Canibacter zhoujuaniae]|uniref:FadR/GntR family transcriptional regulator n=1 Tax=Canibacter zhoujuaniae TaxID=2708343 RepID=UPI001AB05F03|nr:FCD domain-containing protein [Canibacter zhoujuaniae]
MISSRKLDLGSRFNATARAIEEYILQHQLKPGDALPSESELCKALGVSRSSAREALRQLEALEIVSIKQGRGAVVGEMSLRPLVRTLLMRSSAAPDSAEALLQVVLLREVLELGMAEEVVAKLAGTRNEELHATVSEMQSHANQGRSFLEKDIEFHTKLSACLDNSVLEQMQIAMWTVHQESIVLNSTPTPSDLMDTVNAHAAMLRAAESGDLEGYRTAVRAHFHPLKAVLRTVIEEARG